MTAPTRGRHLLVPLIPVYRLGLAIREFRLRHGWEPVRRLGFPVISIGNLSTGGAGKTPFAIATAKALCARGFGVDVLSRGYGRKDDDPARVDPSGSVDRFGDEPVLIAREAGVPVYVARERYEAGWFAENRPSGAKAHSDSGADAARLKSLRKNTNDERAELRNIPQGLKPDSFGGFIGPTEVGPLLQSNVGRVVSEAEKSCPDTERDPDTRRLRVHILDDGFQHRQLYRDVDILLLNREDWRDRLLPAGNLREPVDAARRADVIAIPEDEAALENELRAWGWTGPVWRLRRRMEVPRVDGPVVAFCGIARPEQFFAGLEAAGLRIAARIAFGDHHRYTARDVERLARLAKGVGVNSFVTTQKDEIRLETINPGSGFPTFATKDVAKMGHGSFQFFTVRLTIEIQDEEAALGWLTRRLSDTRIRPSV